MFFETFYLDDAKYTDVTLQILNGEVSGSSHAEIAKHFAELPRENRIVCELGLGMNPNVTDLCGYTVLDEKMAVQTICSAVKTRHPTMLILLDAEKLRLSYD